MVNSVLRYGASALSMAAAGGQLAVTRLLLEAGGEVEDPPAQYRGCPSPAMTAALHGEASVLQLLLASGARQDKVRLSSPHPCSHLPPLSSAVSAH